MPQMAWILWLVVFMAVAFILFLYTTSVYYYPLNTLSSSSSKKYSKTDIIYIW